MHLKGKKALCVIFSIVMSSPIAGVLASRSSSVNDGGGSEQAIMLAGSNLTSVYRNCLQFKRCSGSILKPLLKNLLDDYEWPSVTELVFAIPEEDKDLVTNSFYYRSQDKIVLNRNLLYNDKDKPIKLSQAIGLLTRIYLDDANKVSLSDSQKLVEPLVKFSEASAGQISVGKDVLDLPYSQWILINSFYNTLVIEAPNQFLRLGCPLATIESCSFLAENFQNSENRFDQLSLTTEKEVDGRVYFRVEGVFYSKIQTPQLFSLEGVFEQGSALEIKFQDKAMDLPESLN